MWVASTWSGRGFANAPLGRRATSVLQHQHLRDAITKVQPKKVNGILGGQALFVGRSARGLSLGNLCRRNCKGWAGVDSVLEAAAGMERNHPAGGNCNWLAGLWISPRPFWFVAQ